MGEPIKAQKTEKHFAAPVSPGLSATPFGKRSVPAVKAVTLKNARRFANNTYANGNHLFLHRSFVLEMGIRFDPTESLSTNPVEGSFATAHGNMGKLTYPNGGETPGAINCGVLPGPKADCSAQIAQMLRALVDRTVTEFLDGPFAFYQRYQEGKIVFVGVLKDDVVGLWDGAGKLLSDGYHLAKKRVHQTVEAAGKAYDYVTTVSREQAVKDAIAKVSSGVKAAKEVQEQAANWVNDKCALIEQLSKIDRAQLEQMFMEKFRELVDALGCEAVDLLGEMVTSPKPISTQLAEMQGVIAGNLIEVVAVAAATEGVGLAATRLGGLVLKMGGRAGKFVEGFESLLPKASKGVKAAEGAEGVAEGGAKGAAKQVPRSEPPATKPTKTPPKEEPGGGAKEKPKKEPAEKTPENRDGVEGKGEGKSKPPCQACPTKGKPVNPLFGTKILTDAADLDFELDGPLPLAWQRTYVSGNEHEGWLGQGWTLPIGFRVEVGETLDFIDTQGRRIDFPMLAIGESFFSLFEHITFKRTGRNACEIVTPDGLRLIFGLSEPDRIRLEKEEAQPPAPPPHAAVGADTEAEEDPDTPLQLDNRPPQVEVLVFRGFIDANKNFIKINADEEGLPQTLSTSSGRRLAFVFDTLRFPHAPRLTQVFELMPAENGGEPVRLPLVEYVYSEAGDLIEVRDSNAAVVRTFAWRKHMLIEHAIPGGLVSRYEWDVYRPRGRVIRNTTSAGESWAFTYNVIDGYTDVTDVAGRVTRYHFDEERRFVGVTDPEGGRTTFDLDPYGNLIALTDPAGRVTRHRYDAKGNRLGTIHPDGSTESAHYDDEGRLIAATDALGRTTRYTFDASGNIASVSDPDGGRTEIHYTESGLPSYVVDPRGGSVRFDYDAFGRLVARTDCSGKRTAFEYNSRGTLVALIDALGQRTEFDYQSINRQDRPVLVRTPDGAEERFAYDPLGRLVAHRDPLGRATRYAYDTDGRLTLRQNALGHTLAYRYDVHGRLTTLVNENKASWRFAYDRLDRLTAEQGFDGRRIDYEYDRAGFLIESVDGVPAGTPHMAHGVSAPLVRTWLRRDAMGRLLERLSVRTGEGLPRTSRTRFTYDAAGQLLRARNAFARIDLHYTLGGQIAREITRARHGQTFSLIHDYDALGNRVATTLPDGRTVNTLTYGSGHVHQINLDGEVVCDFERDALHREISRTQGTLATHYALDPMGRLLESRTGRTSPALGGNMALALPKLPRLGRQYRYDEAGQLVSFIDARGGQTHYRYDAIGRLTAATHGGKRESFAFDPAHNLIEREESLPAKAPEPWTDERWAAYVKAHIHEPDFNPLLVPEQMPDPALWGGAGRNRLPAWGGQRYAYDTWGNCTRRRKIQGLHASDQRYTWDAEHRLVGVEIVRVKGQTRRSETWAYDYDPFGRRIAKHRIDTQGKPEQSTWFAWDGDRLLLEITPKKAPGKKKPTLAQTLYLYEPNSFRPLALVRGTVEAAPPKPSLPFDRMVLEIKDQAPEVWARIEATRQNIARSLGANVPTLSEAIEPARQKVGASEIFYVHTDHLGTPRELTDTDGQLVWTAEYKAWGRAEHIAHPARCVTRVEGNTVQEHWEAQEDPVVQNLRFQGQYFDEETGLHYNRYRYYDPDVGRFLAQDPIKLAGGENLYQYAPSPIMWIDPLGLVRCPLRDAKGRFRKPITALEELQQLPELKGMAKADIEKTLKSRGYSSVPGFGGGQVWTKAMPDGNTAAVRIDPASPRQPALGYADEVPHAHKETVSTSNVSGGNYKPKHSTALDDFCNLSTGPAAAHIPIR